MERSDDSVLDSEAAGGGADCADLAQEPAWYPEHARCLATLLEVSRRVVATLDLQTVLQATTDGVTDLAGLDTAAVYLTRGDTLRLWATTPPLPDGFPEALRDVPRGDHPHLVAAIDSHAPVAIEDALTADLTPGERSVVDARELRTILYIPLVTGLRSVGALIVGSVAVPRQVPGPVVDLCRTLANLAAMAVENAQLFEASQANVAELERTLHDRERVERERLELERRLLHAQRLESLGLLAGGIAHDFNNLLMAIHANLELALLKLGPTSPARQDLEQSIRAARRATNLTGQMLAYAGKRAFEVATVDVDELVAENKDLFGSSVGTRITFEVQPGGGLPPIEADLGQLQQVVMNLITNASEAIGNRPGRITIATGTDHYDHRELAQGLLEEVPPAGQYVHLQVSDTGCGMESGTRERLFEPFFSTKGAGRGLGMSAILGIVRGHHGTLFVDSAVGEGTTVRVLFPALANGESRTATSTGEVPAPEDVRLAGTVLVVDDEELVRNACRSMAEFLGLEVFTAADGQKAVELFRQHAEQIDCVLLDLTMPNMDGVSTFEALVRIKPDVKVLIASGYDEQEFAQRNATRGIAGFLQKPFSMEQLIDALRPVVGE